MLSNLEESGVLHIHSACFAGIGRSDWLHQISSRIRTRHNESMLNLQRSSRRTKRARTRTSTNTRTRNLARKLGVEFPCLIIITLIFKYFLSFLNSNCLMFLFFLRNYLATPASSIFDDAASYYLLSWLREQPSHRRKWWPGRSRYWPSSTKFVGCPLDRILAGHGRLILPDARTQ